MKTRLPFLLVFLGIFLLTQPAVSGTLNGNKSWDPFSFSYTTVSTSQKLAGHGSVVWQVTGSASITGTAEAYEEADAEYNCEMYLMATGDLVSSPFPSKSNINTTKSGGDGENFDVYTQGDASISYKSHVVSNSRTDRRNPGARIKKRNLSDSLSESYAKSTSSPTDNCASPEAYGSLDGTLQNFVGGKTLSPLMIQSETNKACADSPDDGTEEFVAENCHRGQNCQFPGTATSEFAHRVECPEEIWVLAGEAFGIQRFEKQACPSWRWTCDDDPEDPATVNQCLRTSSHVKPGEWSWRLKYVDPSTGESVSTADCMGGCGDVIPATAQSSYHWVEACEGCGKDFYSCTQSGAHGIVHNVHAPASMKCGHLYRLCASGDHGLKQASCLKDPDCIATNFWLCQHTTHQYAGDLSPGTEAPTVPTTLMCRNFHTYSTRDASAVAYHAEVKTCTRCGVSYVECDASDSAKSGCSSGYVWHTTEAQSPDPPPSTDLPPSTDPPSRDPPAEDKEDCGVHIKGTSGSHA